MSGSIYPLIEDKNYIYKSIGLTKLEYFAGLANSVDSIYRNLFLKHHQFADSITINHENRPLSVTYTCGDLRDKR